MKKDTLLQETKFQRRQLVYGNVDEASYQSRANADGQKNEPPGDVLLHHKLVALLSLLVLEKIVLARVIIETLKIRHKPIKR